MPDPVGCWNWSRPFPQAENNSCLNYFLPVRIWWYSSQHMGGRPRATDDTLGWRETGDQFPIIPLYDFGCDRRLTWLPYSLIQLLSVCIYLSVSVCMSLHLSVSVCIYLSVFVCIYLSVSVCLSLSWFVTVVRTAAWSELKNIYLKSIQKTFCLSNSWGL